MLLPFAAPISGPRMSNAASGLYKIHPEVSLPLDLEEPDRDPHRVLMGPRRRQVHDPLKLLAPPVRVLRVITPSGTTGSEAGVGNPARQGNVGRARWGAGGVAVDPVIQTRPDSPSPVQVHAGPRYVPDAERRPGVEINHRRQSPRGRVRQVRRR